MAASAEENITVLSETEYKDYVYNVQHDIWSLVTLKAPVHEEEDENKRAPIDIVAVMDKSGSMAGEKLDLVKKTMEFVLTQLNENDQLALVTYDTSVYLDFGFRKMTKENKEASLQKIREIRDGSMTNLSGGLLKGLVQVLNRPENAKNDVASVLLFTDGLANHGITHIDGIIAAMKDPRRFDGPSSGSRSASSNSNSRSRQVQQQSRSPGGPMKMMMKKKGKKAARPPSPPSSDSEPEVESLPELQTVVEPEPAPAPPAGSGEDKSANAFVYTFGFGEDHDAELLKKISDAGNGMYYFIETEDKIGASFAHCLGGLMSTVAQGIQMQINTHPGVLITDVHTSRSVEKENDQRSIKVNMGDLQSEEGRDIVLQLKIDALSEPCEETPQPLFDVNVDYFNVISSSLGNSTNSLGVLRPANESKHDEETVSPVVTKEKCRVNMTKAMNEANRKADLGDYDGAKSLLTNQIDLMQKQKAVVAKYHCNKELEEEFEAMAADLDECKINASHAKVWNAKGKKMQMNKMQMYSNQRASEATSKAFKTKKKMGFVAKSEQFFDNVEE